VCSIRRQTVERFGGRCRLVRGRFRLLRDHRREQRLPVYPIQMRSLKLENFRRKRWLFSHSNFMSSASSTDNVPCWIKSTINASVVRMGRLKPRFATFLIACLSSMASVSFRCTATAIAEHSPIPKPFASLRRSEFTRPRPTSVGPLLRNPEGC